MQVAYIKKMEIVDSPRKIKRKERLIALLAMHGGATQVAIESGTPKSHISALVNGTRAVGDKLASKFESLYGKPIGWFDMENVYQVAEPRAHYGNKPEIDLENNPDYPSVKRVNFKLSAGTSGFGVDYDSIGDDAPIVFSKRFYTKNGYDPTKLFAVKVANGSMEPGLNDGDTVVVNTEQKEPKDSIVFAVNYEGQLVIKRMIRDAGEWWLSSDNPDQRRYPRKLCDENTFVIGEIVHKQSERI